MVFQVADEVDFPSYGIRVAGFVVCIVDDAVQVQRLSDASYRLSFLVTYFASPLAWQERRLPIRENHSVSFTVPQLLSDPVTICYSALKSEYGNTSDL